MGIQNNSNTPFIPPTTPIKTKQVKKGTILQHPGDSSDFAYIVESGMLRSYTIDDKGKEHIFQFAPEGWIISDMEMQSQDQPAELFIDALEDSTLKVFNRKDVDYTIMPPDDVFPRLFKRMGVLQRRIMMLISSPAKDRYEHFLETYPGIANRVPQRMIASYLGITPEALSKIRRQRV
jgi:CRP-like cAMP-binding protein